MAAHLVLVQYCSINRYFDSKYNNLTKTHFLTRLTVESDTDVIIQDIGNQNFTELYNKK